MQAVAFAEAVPPGSQPVMLEERVIDTGYGDQPVPSRL